MKEYIKRFLHFKKIHDRNSEIKKICKKWHITNYTINDDESIDVDGNVFFHGNIKLTSIPLKFREVTGVFDCSSHGLKSLEGSPTSVGGDFNCSHNNLKDLKGSPRWVGGCFICVDNKLETLEGAPQWVGSNFDCGHNNLNTLYGIVEVGTSIYCEHNEIFDFGNTIKKVADIVFGYNQCDDLGRTPIYSIWRHFMEAKLIDLFNDYDIIRKEGDQWVVIMDRLIGFFEDIDKRYYKFDKHYNYDENRDVIIDLLKRNLSSYYTIR
jgi:hypothetical protein